jgi:hypothetical protein
VQALTGESPLTLEEALTLGAPSAEEEQKRSILRALKDLEFERGVGKISEEDYAELSERYRAEARRLIQLLDAGSGPERERAEKALRERLAKTGHATGEAKPNADEKPAVDSASDPPADAAVSEPAAASAPNAAEEGKAPS